MATSPWRDAGGGKRGEGGGGVPWSGRLAPRLFSPLHENDGVLGFEPVCPTRFHPPDSTRSSIAIPTTSYVQSRVESGQVSVSMLSGSSPKTPLHGVGMGVVV